MRDYIKTSKPIVNVTVYSVVYDVGEQDDVFRTLDKATAEAFAVGRRCWGRPARVMEETVPANIVKRWSL